MEVAINAVPVTVNVVRVDNKKLTNTMLEQIKIYSLLDYIMASELDDFEWDENDYTFICRISAAPVLKVRKANLANIKSVIVKPDPVERMLASNSYPTEFGLWSVGETLFLHPIGYKPGHKTRYAGPFSNVHESWFDILNTFDECFEELPIALTGV